MAVDQMNERTPFQVLAEEVITEILRRHGTHCSFLPYGYLDGAPSFCASFSWKGQKHTIELYGVSIVMFGRERLYEVYMPAEFKGDQAYVGGFGERLVDRYLFGGDWAGPDEAGALERRLRNIWSSWKRWRQRLSGRRTGD